MQDGIILIGLAASAWAVTAAFGLTHPPRHIWILTLEITGIASFLIMRAALAHFHFH